MTSVSSLRPRVAVAGASGFVGTQVLPALAAQFDIVDVATLHFRVTATLRMTLVS
jgi:uncharacterized protein YbjT (DUF2867 family)